MKISSADLLQQLHVGWGCWQRQRLDRRPAKERGKDLQHDLGALAQRDDEPLAVGGPHLVERFAGGVDTSCALPLSMRWTSSSVWSPVVDRYEIHCLSGEMRLRETSRETVTNGRDRQRVSGATGVRQSRNATTAAITNPAASASRTSIVNTATAEAAVAVPEDALPASGAGRLRSRGRFRVDRPASAEDKRRSAARARRESSAPDGPPGHGLSEPHVLDVLVRMAPVNGKRPAMHSNRITPSEKMSANRGHDAPFGLFRRHVMRGASMGSCGRSDDWDSPVGSAGWIEVRQSEIEQLYMPVRRHHDVRRLEVAMDEAAVVRVREPFGDLEAELNRGLERRHAASKHRGQRLAVYELHQDELLILCLNELYTRQIYG